MWKNVRYAHFAEMCEKCGNMRNMRQLHICIKLTCLDSGQAGHVVNAVCKKYVSLLSTTSMSAM